MIDKRSSLYNITTPSNEVLLTLRILSIYPMFWIGMTIRLAALFFALPWMVDVWFLPFVSSYVENWTLDPWSHFLNQGGDPVSYPYGPVMLFVHSFGTSIGYLIDQVAGTTIFYSIGFKSSLLVADLFCLLLLDRLFPGNIEKIVLYYWLSPIVLFTVYWVGQNDLIPVALFLFGLYWAKHQRFFRASLCLALAVGAKFSMAVGLPLYFIYLLRNKKYREFVIPAIQTLIGVIIVVQVIPLFSMGFRLMVTSTPEISRIFDFAFSIGQGVNIYVAPLLYLLVLYFVWRLSRFSYDLLLAMMGLSFFLILLVTPAPIGWYLWLLPFLVFHQLTTDRLQAFLVFAFSSLVTLNHVLFTEGPRLPIFNLTVMSIEDYYSFPDLILDRSLWITGIIIIGSIIMLQMLRLNVQRNDYFRISRRPLLIGICGDSGTGKDILATSIEDIFGRHSVLQISGDDYHSWDRHAPMWKALTHLSPRANDLFKMSRDVISLLAGHSTAQQSYDHSSGRFVAARPHQGNDVVIVSGLHALFDPDLVRRYDVTIYLDPSEDLKRYWKIQRDMQSRNWDEQSIFETMERRAKDAERFIQPQKERADLIFRMMPANENDLKHAFENNDYSQKIRCKLEVSLKSGLYWEALVRDLVGLCGLHVDTEFPREPGVVEIHVEGDLAPEDIALSATKLPKAMLELLAMVPQWHSDMLGVMQLIVITQIELALRNRL